ncbi:MAG: nucleotidyltransferase domain-containing protein [Gemmatimonadaceae bacterium]
MPEMSSADLSLLLDLFEARGISVWLDGGWGVDALLGNQMRTHKDVDIVIALGDVPRLQDILAEKGFVVREGIVPHSFVLVDSNGLEVDVHSAQFNERGDGIYRMQNGEDWIFTAEDLTGIGSIGGKAVKCLTPEAQVKGHAYGYVPTEKDFRDMERLAELFGVLVPNQLKR